MKKGTGISLAALLVVMLLTACSNSNSGSSKNDHQATPAPTKHDPVKLAIQNAYNPGEDEAQFMEKYGDDIIKKFPYISFEYSSSKDLDSRITAGGDIDILETSVGLTPSNLLDYNLQYDISGLIAKNKYDLSRLEPTTVQMQRDFAKGGIYGLPISTTTLALFYNKDIFDKFGVAYPRDGMTWDDTYELAKKVSRTDNGVKYAGFGMSMVHMMRLNQLSLPYLDPKTNQPLFADNNFKKLVTNFTRFNEIPGNEDPSFGNNTTTLNKFVKDKTLAMFTFTYGVAYKSLSNWDVATIPSFKDSMGVAAQSYPLFFYITSTSKHKDEAFDVISYLTSEEFQLKNSELGTASILNDSKVRDAFATKADDLKGKNVKALVPTKYAPPSPYNKDNSTVEGSLLNAIKLVQQGKADINTAMAQAVENANKAIKDKTAK